MAAKNHISREITEEVRSRNNIVDVISECGVALKQVGTNYKALCPFHEEKTPSFSVSAEKQIFYCFGCQTGGDVIHFLQKHEGKNFIESIEWLANRAHITLPARDAKDSARQKRINDLSELNTFAVKYYHELLRTGQHSQHAREYLKNRGIITKTTNHFQLGYAKSERRDLVKTTTQEGWTVEQLVDVGLIKNEDKGPQDRFWNRLLFPIHNERGIPVGFGGRALSDEHQPKYLNSPGTDLYNKSRILYNLDKARQSIARKKSAILVEGYMDVLMLHQHGIENVIATSGTSLSKEHGELLKRYTPEVVIVFDGDAAGLQAAQRGLNRLIAEEIRVRVALMPKGDDPDSFVKENGADAFTKRIDRSINLIEFQIQTAAQEKNIRRPDVITRVVRDISELLVNIKNRVERAEYVKYAVRELNLDEGIIWKELRGLGLKETPAVSHKTSAKKMTAREQIELQFIQSLLQAPEYIQAVKSVFDYNDISQPHLAKIAEMLWQESENGDTVDIQHILDNCEDEKLKSAITRLLISGQAISNHYAIIQGCIKKLINYICQDVEQRERSDAVSEGDDDLEKLKKLVALSNDRRAYVQKKVKQLKQNTENTNAATDTPNIAKDIK